MAVFSELGVNVSIELALAEEYDIKVPTTVQKNVIPTLISGKDVFIQSETGTGKTLSYVVPILQRLSSESLSSVCRRENDENSTVTNDEAMHRADKRMNNSTSRVEHDASFCQHHDMLKKWTASPERERDTKALIIAPTRELATQIYEVFAKLLLKRREWQHFVPGYLMGGEKKKSEKARLRKGVSVLVATPGRLLDHLRTTQSLHLERLQFLVLDEGDLLIQHGFLPTIRSILGLIDTRKVPNYSRQTILCSATLKDSVRELMLISCNNPVFITTEHKADTTSITGAVQYAIPTQLRQFYCVCPSSLRLVALYQFLQNQCWNAPKAMKIIVFFSNCASVDFHFDLFSTFDEELVAAQSEAERLKAMSVREDIAAQDEFTMLLDNCREPDSMSKTKKNKRKEHFLKSNNESQQVLDDAIRTFKYLVEEQTIEGSSIPMMSGALFKLHGDLAQNTRQRVFHSYCKAKNQPTHDILFCTDVAARGLNFPNVDYIVHYDVPASIEDYVHRIGRTARMGLGGTSLIFILPSELKYTETLKVSIPNCALEQANMTIFLGAKGKLVRNAGAGTDKNAPKLKPKHDGKLDGENTVTDLSLDSNTEWSLLTPVAKKRLNYIQSLLEKMVASNSVIKEEARRAFLAHIRAYATHDRKEKDIFHVKRLHLGHVARSFALRDAPRRMGDQYQSKEKEFVQSLSKKTQSDMKKDREKSRKRTFSSAQEFDSGIVAMSRDQVFRKRRIKIRV